MVALLALAAIASGTARGEDAESLIKDGIELRRAGDDQAAHKLFVRAYQLARTPRGAAQLGLCEQALSRWVDAETHLSEALRGGRDPWIKKNRVVLDGSMETVKSHLGRVAITGRPAGASVEVDGRAVGALPLTAAVRVAAGEVNVRVASDGHEVGRRVVAVKPGELVSISVELERSLVVAAPALAVAPPAPSVITMAAPGAAQPAPDESRPVLRTWWFWTAAAVVVAGGVGLTLALSRADPKAPMTMGGNNKVFP